MEMEKDTHAFLFELRVRGMLARMFSLRRVEPSEMEMQILTGVTDATVRDMAEIAYRLGFEIDLLPIELFRLKQLEK